MKEQTIEVMYDHYKETCTLMRDAVNKRERYVIYFIISLIFVCVFSIFPQTVSTIIREVLSTKYGISAVVDIRVVYNIIWFICFYVALRYFQINININRSYDYIQGLEERLSKSNINYV